MKPISQKFSHRLLTLTCVLLSTFSLGSGIALFTTSEQLKGLSGVDGLTLYLLVAAIVVTVCAGVALVCSWKRRTCFLHVYELVCLVGLVSFTLILTGIAMVGVGGTSEVASQDAACYAPKNYFQFKMLQNFNKAQALLCSATCPCPNNTQIQQCPTWTTTPYDMLMQKLEQQFSCSGWCAVGNKTSYFFSNPSENGPVNGPCRRMWVNWVNSQWKAVIGCVSAMLAILLANVLATNWRILRIWGQDDQ